MRLAVRGPDLFAEDRESDLYAAIDCVTKKIEQQIRKRHSKRKAAQTQSRRPQQTHPAGSRIWNDSSRPHHFARHRAAHRKRRGVVSGNHIRAVGPWTDLQPHTNEKILDLGEVILLPGLVNAHCHLDYTDMAGQLPPPKTFTDWIRVYHSPPRPAGVTPNMRARGCNGAHMLLKTGTTTVADIEADARIAAGNVGRHAAARFFISGNDRHPRAARPEGNFARGHRKN